MEHLFVSWGFRNLLSVRVGMELPRVGDSAVKLTQEGLTSNSKPLLAPSGIRAARRQLLLLKDIELRQCKSSELCWLSNDPDRTFAFVRRGFPSESIRNGVVMFIALMAWSKQARYSKIGLLAAPRGAGARGYRLANAGQGGQDSL